MGTLYFILFDDKMERYREGVIGQELPGRRALRRAVGSVSSASVFRDKMFLPHRVVSQVCHLPVVHLCQVTHA